MPIDFRKDWEGKHQKKNQNMRVSSGLAIIHVGSAQDQKHLTGRTFCKVSTLPNCPNCWPLPPKKLSPYYANGSKLNSVPMWYFSISWFYSCPMYLCNSIAVLEQIPVCNCSSLEMSFQLFLFLYHLRFRKMRVSLKTGYGAHKTGLYFGVWWQFTSPKFQKNASH